MADKWILLVRTPKVCGAGADGRLATVSWAELRDESAAIAAELAAEVSCQGLTTISIYWFFHCFYSKSECLCKIE